MMGKLKVFQTTSDIDWRKVIITNAIKYVDPVFVRLRDRVPIPKEPQERVKYAQGQTFKRYNEHGRWINDTEAAHPVVEDIMRGFTFDQGTVFGNGFIEDNGINSFRQWCESIWVPRRNKRPIWEEHYRPLKRFRPRHCVNTDEL
ncbi:hypothetical protein BDV06DRAFT_221412 [Aspergillus oleicola]